MLSILGTPTLQGENKHVKWAETTACFCCSHSSRHNEPAMSVCQIRHNGVFLGTAAMITWKGFYCMTFKNILKKRAGWGGLCMQGKPRKTKHPNLHQDPRISSQPQSCICTYNSSSRHVAVPLNAYKALFILGLSPLGIRVPLNKQCGRGPARQPNTSAAPALLFLSW